MGGLGPPVDHNGSPSESVVRDVSLTVSDWGRWRLHPVHSCYLGLRGLPSLHGPPTATLPGLAWTNLPDLRLAVGGLRLSSGASPRRVPRCSVQQPAGQAVKMGNAQGEPPQPTPDAKGAGVPERKIGSEALEASVKLRRSSIECLSAASFEAARSEQLRLPAEGPLKRRDGSSCKSTLNPLPGLGFTTHGITLFVKEPR